MARFPEYVDNIRRCSRPTGSGSAWPAATHTLRATPHATSVPRRLAARLVGLLGPARRREGPALRLRAPLLRPGHRRGARALPQRVPAVGRAPRAAHLPDRQRRRGARRQQEADRLVLPNLRSMVALRTGQPLTRSSSSRTSRRATPTSPVATSPGRCWSAGWSARPTRRPRRSRELATHLRRRRGDGAPGGRRPSWHADRRGACPRGDPPPAGRWPSPDVRRSRVDTVP